MEVMDGEVACFYVLFGSGFDFLETIFCLLCNKSFDRLATKALFEFEAGQNLVTVYPYSVSSTLPNQ